VVRSPIPANTWTFRSEAKTHSDSLRSVPVRATLERVRACADRVPITRVSDLTPLDRLQLPVFSVTTPLARDLTTHMGKGLDRDSAQVSAMMEAVERVSAETTGREIRRVSFRQLTKEQDCVADPVWFELPDDSRYAPDQPISWVEGWDLLRGEMIWVPLDVAVSPPQDGVLNRVDTNGLAAGNTVLEAVVHALCEVIERDALGLLLFRSMCGDAERPASSPRRIDVASLPPQVAGWLDRIQECDLRIETELLDTDVEIPVFRTNLVDVHYPFGSPDRPRTFLGLGAGPSAVAAVTRSITESVQSRLAIVQGARDTFNAIGRCAAARPGSGSDSRPRLPLGRIETFCGADLLDDLSFLVGRLRAVGLSRIIAIDLTRPEFDIPVVRVRVPGLTSFAVDRTRMGLRCWRYLL
jgi:ribosomal protein S12 methylthiotransferase accessory factor